MKLNIGRNIRELRRERDMTQDELAEQLGVTYQSVSRWENGACYPDMELLPVLAEIFGISVDALIGLDRAQEQQEIAVILEKWQSASGAGDVPGCIALALEGLEAHPGSHELRLKLMDALFMAGDTHSGVETELLEGYARELMQLGEKILKYCDDGDIRMKATVLMAFQQKELGNVQAARDMIGTLPSAGNARELHMWRLTEGAERTSCAQELVYQSWRLMSAGLWRLMGDERLTAVGHVRLMEAERTIEKLMLADVQLPDDGEGKVRYARIYAKTGQHAQALALLREAAGEALAYADAPESLPYGSLFIGERSWRRDELETSDGRSAVQKMREEWLMHPDLDILRGTAEFREILASLDV